MLMVVGVAACEPVDVIETQQAKNVNKESVKPPRLEHGLMAQFMESIQKEGVACAVQQEEQGNGRPGQSAMGQKGRSPGESQQAQKAAGLEPPLQVAALGQLAEQRRFDR